MTYSSTLLYLFYIEPRLFHHVNNVVTRKLIGFHRQNPLWIGRIHGPLGNAFHLIERWGHFSNATIAVDVGFEF